MGLVTTDELSGDALAHAEPVCAVASATLYVISAYDGEGALFCERCETPFALGAARALPIRVYRRLGEQRCCHERGHRRESPLGAPPA